MLRAAQCLAAIDKAWTGSDNTTKRTARQWIETREDAKDSQRSVNNIASTFKDRITYYIFQKTDPGGPHKDFNAIREHTESIEVLSIPLEQCIELGTVSEYGSGLLLQTKRHQGEQSRQILAAHYNSRFRPTLRS